MHKALLLLTLMAFWPAAHSAELSQTALREIDLLLGALGSSNCRSIAMANGTVPQTPRPPHEEVRVLRKKKLLGSAEDFITGAGTESSRSGQPYQVQCGQEDAVPSAVWLQAALRRLRSAPNAGTK